MTLLETLRSATHDLHEALHQHPLLLPLQQQTIKEIEYQRVIQAFELAYRTSEAACAVHPAPVQDVPVLAWLAADIEAHQIRPIDEIEIHYPPITDMSLLWGYLYVKQGSTLGGRIISRNLSASLGLVDGKTNHFFAGFGEETGARWKGFVAALEKSGADADAAAAQAVATFTLIRTCCDTILSQALMSGVQAASSG